MCGHFGRRITVGAPPSSAKKLDITSSPVHDDNDHVVPDSKLLPLEILGNKLQQNTPAQTQGMEVCAQQIHASLIGEEFRREFEYMNASIREHDECIKALETTVLAQGSVQQSHTQQILATNIMPSTKLADKQAKEILTKKVEAIRTARLKGELLEEAEMNHAKHEILYATSNADLLMKAELLINENWLSKYDGFHGNIYRIGAFGDLQPATDKIFSTDFMKAAARFMGCVAIFLIQLLGPVAVFFSTIAGWGIEDDEHYDWSAWHFGQFEDMITDWQVAHMTKVLAVLFIFAFVLNGLFCVLDEQKSWKNIYNTFRFLQMNTPNFEVHGASFLYLCAFVNCWLITWCCIDAFVVIGAARTPKDLLMDSLGLLFLYNLDDIGGDLGFVDMDDWPGLQLAWIY